METPNVKVNSSVLLTFEPNNGYQINRFSAHNPDERTLLNSGQSIFVSAFVEGIKVLVSKIPEIEEISITLMASKIVTKIRINPEQSVNLQLGTWRSRAILEVGVEGHLDKRID